MGGMADVPGGPSEGWYDDADDPSQLRWWDGVRWTDQRRPKPMQAPPPAFGMAREDPFATLKPTVVTTSRRPIYIAAGAAVGFMVLLLIIGMLTGGGSKPGDTTGSTQIDGPIGAIAVANDEAAKANLSRASTAARIVMTPSDPSSAAGGTVTPQSLSQSEPSLKFVPAGGASVDVISVRSAAPGDVYLVTASPSGTFFCTHLAGAAQTYGSGETEEAAVLRCGQASW